MNIVSFGGGTNSTAMIIGMYAQRAADNQRCQLRGGGLAVTVQRSLPDALSKLNKSLNSDGHNNR